MKEGNDGFLRADQIDLKSLDEQLERHLSRAWTMEKNTNNNNGSSNNNIDMSISSSNNSSFNFRRDGEMEGKGNERSRRREEWEIDPSKLIVKGVIARGTFGTVHRGVYDNMDVAVKLLEWGEEGNRTETELASLRSAFTQEVAVWHKLDHPNVTKGGALKSFLIKNRRKKLAFRVVVQVALDLARGLSYLHSKKIVHRDVKTENMLLDKTHTIKIADFGVARVEASNPNDMTGETGTLGYMAPEVLNGNPYNRKCDVYSFGICLWEIYCCDMPYPDLSFSEVTSAVVRQNLRPEIPRCCPSSLANVMKRCWDANPDKRPEMDEVVVMLEAIDTSKGGAKEKFPR
ncbi:Serine/threonine-protein kinase HT1 [Acorus gramineus]|uniref:non-specific serine/threonine protein kinase n=1 Tax=Acorus gramineus TaxID=55184 RepID=A0AAV9BS72_ACOGR|nr:Serine/threonine-protein kinase HT1 [Acorus gramineus]